MKLKALIYFEILFNSTDLLEKTTFKNKTVEVNTVKNEGRIYKKFKRTKTTPDIFGAECYLHGKTKTILSQIVPQIKEEFFYRGGPKKTKKFYQKCRLIY